MRFSSIKFIYAKSGKVRDVAEKKTTNKTTADLLAVAKTINIKKAAAIIGEVKTAVSNWAGYAAQTNVAERLWKGIAKELMGVWWMLGFG